MTLMAIDNHLMPQSQGSSKLLKMSKWSLLYIDQLHSTWALSQLDTSGRHPVAFNMTLKVGLATGHI